MLGICYFTIFLEHTDVRRVFLFESLCRRDMPLPGTILSSRQHFARHRQRYASVNASRLRCVYHAARLLDASPGAPTRVLFKRHDARRRRTPSAMPRHKCISAGDFLLPPATSMRGHADSPPFISPPLLIGGKRRGILSQADTTSPLVARAARPPGRAARNFFRFTSRVPPMATMPRSIRAGCRRAVLEGRFLLDAAAHATRQTTKLDLSPASCR